MADVEKNIEAITSQTENITNNIADSAKNMANVVTDKTTETITKATETAKKIIEPYTTSTGAIYGLILVILIASITSYVLYVIVTGVLFKKSRDVIEGTKIPIVCNEKRRIPISSFSSSGNGQRRSYSFWIYINDMTKYSGVYKHVFHIGDEKTIINASPFVFLDKYNNKLFIRFSTTGIDTVTTAHTSIANLTDIEFRNFMRQGISIPYIPIQRWVHVAVVINENVNGGTVTSYVDGEMSSVITTNEISEYGDSINVSQLDIDKKGDLHIGGDAYSTDGPGFSGLISRIVMYNYDLNQKDVYREYNEGPIDGLLAKLGLGAYGIRSPIYRVI